MEGTDGLKNRGRTRADVDARREAASAFSGADLSALADYSFDPEAASRNVENMVGVAQVPLGFAGPMRMDGEHARGDFLVPMATTEGALVASTSRGMSVVSASGGVRARVVRDAMTRAPVLRVDGIDHGMRVVRWVEENGPELAAAVSETTGHGRLAGVEPFLNGRSLHLRLSFSTGDAMGMNMATIASEAVCALIERETGAKAVSVSGNMCADKKPAAINCIRGRGKTVLAEATVPAEAVEGRLHTSVADILEVHGRKVLVGSAMAGSMGFNAHAANMVAAVFIATGQDPAQVVEASGCFTTCEDAGGALYIAVRIPSLELGTVGGGTRLPSQRAALSMMGCIGDGKAQKLAEIVAGAVLCGELSTLAAQAAGQLGGAHRRLGRRARVRAKR